MLATRHKAFTLIELLVVISIIGIVVALAVPATQSALRGSALDSGSSLLMEQMSLGRQEAISRNRTVEVRIYRFADPEAPGEDPTNPETGFFRSIQLFERTENGGFSALTKSTRLPELVVMNPSARLSTILGEDPANRLITKDKVQADPNNNPELPRVGRNYSYIAFRFFPNGGTDLSATKQWHITIHATSDLPRTSPPAYNQAPPNYVCWAVDPVTGIGRVYRPGL